MTGLIPSLENVPSLAIGFGGPWEIAIIAGIVLLLFGNRLPSAAKSLGMSFNAFKKGIKEGEEEVGSSVIHGDENTATKNEEEKVNS